MEAKKGTKPIIGIDIGGTLAKVCVCLQDDQTVGRPLPSNIRELNVNCQDGTMCSFHKFQSSDIEEMLNFLKAQKLIQKGDVIHVSGGGAHKYGNIIEKELEVELRPVDEMTSIAKGIEYLVRNAPDSRFSYSKITGRFTLGSTEEYPYLLVNIGSGVSILKFNSSKEYERIGGTALGGGTFLGLCNMILNEGNFETLMDLTAEGDNMKVDLGFDDVYKTSDSPKNAHNTGFGFEKEIIGVSLGKLDSNKKTDELDKGAIAKSLLYMTAYNIAQIAYLSAKLENIHTIYFAGNFIRGNATTMNTISTGLELFSNMYQFPVTAIFLKHDGFLGALGCIEISSSSITVPV